MDWGLGSKRRAQAYWGVLLEGCLHSAACSTMLGPWQLQLRRRVCSQCKVSMKYEHLTLHVACKQNYDTKE
eukprot:202742-Amphidinium_carterae.1